MNSLVFWFGWLWILVTHQRVWKSWYYIFHSFIWWLLIFNFPLTTQSQLLITDWHQQILLLWVNNIMLHLFQWYVCLLVPTCSHPLQLVWCVPYYYMLAKWYAPIVHINKCLSFCTPRWWCLVITSGEACWGYIILRLLWVSCNYIMPSSETG